MRLLLVVVALLGPGLQVQPRAHITEGPKGEVPETRATFAFEETGAAPLNTTTFECRLDGGPWAACTSPHTVDGLTGGPHAFAVRAAGPLADPAPDEREWTVAQRTELIPAKPNPVVQPPHPVAPPVRLPRRRDAGGCPYGGNQPGEVRAARLRRAILCLVNAERARRDLQPVRRSARLELSATRHVRDMVARRYFAHETPTGITAADRARRAGYLRGARAWTVGEILAWLVDPRPTAAGVVRAWMNSPGHRHVILRASLRDAGVGIARGNPRIARGLGATFAVEFGRRA